MSMKNDIIKYVRLKRFQKHDDTKLEFSPGLNIIIGETDNGKSSIVRAIRWLIENKPSGSKFVQRGCDANAVVEISFGDTIIKRVRGKKDNYYLYNGEK